MKIRAVVVLLFVCATAAMAADRPQRRYINLPGRPLEAPFSDAILIGDTLYLAGRIGLDPKTGRAPADVEQEARLLLDGFKAVLKEANMSMDDLVFVQVYCTDLSLFPRFNAVYRTYFSQEFPARAFIGAGSLLLGGSFEMQGIAVKR